MTEQLFQMLFAACYFGAGFLTAYAWLRPRKPNLDTST
jgi:hypothetical protein